MVPATAGLVWTWRNPRWVKVPVTVLVAPAVTVTLWQAGVV
jgi:hypothetical protein